MKADSFAKIITVFFLTLCLTGCTVIFQTGRRTDAEKIDKLSQQLDELTQTKKLLEERLSKEINDKQVKLQMMEKGLVITFVADVLFDSGKAKIKPEAYSILDKVARVLKENIPELSVGIEGHTDNVPIKHSGWKSNWELSTSRALSVLHYLVEQKEISPDRVSAIGYGEYKPVSSNDTKEGRAANRRVEVVILPRLTKANDFLKESESKSKKITESEPEENLK